MAITVSRSLRSASMTSSVVNSTTSDAIRENGPGPELRLISGDIPADLLITDWQTSMQAEGLSERTWTDWPAIVRRAAKHTGQHPGGFTTAALTTYLASHRNANTKATYYRGLAAFHAWLVRAGHRDDDPMARIKPPRVPRGTPHPITTAGLERLLSMRLHKRTAVMILLGAYQGLRVHEIAKVRGEDVDLDEHTLRVLGKGGVDAVLPLHPMVAAAAAGMPRRGWWFASYADRRRPIHAGSVSLTISQAMTRAGVAGSAHSLRHWYATQLLNCGASAVTAQHLMRHSSLNTLAVYARVDFSQMRAAADRLPQPRAGDAEPAGAEMDAAEVLRELRELRALLAGLTTEEGEGL